MRTLPRAPLSPTSSLLESFNTSKTSRPRRTPTNSISYEPTAKNGCFCNEPRQSPSPLTRHLYVARIPTFLLCLDKCVHLKRKFEQPWASGDFGVQSDRKKVSRLHKGYTGPGRPPRYQQIPLSIRPPKTIRLPASSRR